MTDALAEPGNRTDAFQVDLRGVVDLLARHLYSSPRVYLRELLQNGVDAITARRALDTAAGLGGHAPDAAAGEAHARGGSADRASDHGRILLRPLEGGGLEVVDSGIGLTADEARELLATIGRSSKRDVELGNGREEFLGQFGIGLLSAFMVADEIDLVSRSARPCADGGAPSPVRWRGHADGRYELTEIADDDPAAAPLDGGAGSVVRLYPRRDMEHWLAPESVTALAQDFGGLLPVDLSVEVVLDDGTVARRRLTGADLPWRQTFRTPEARDAALRAYAERTLGFRPLAYIDLDIPVAGLSGIAYILPAAVAPTTVAHHRVYLKRMLLGTNVDQVLPPWAFFVRCVIDASALRPTASREGLYEDEVLLATREALGAQVRRWTLDTLTMQGPVARRFVEVHHLAVRALALTDDEMLDLAVSAIPFESTAGECSLADLNERVPDSPLLYTTTLEEFRRIAAVAAAKGIVVVNGGYVYDADLLARAARLHPELRLSAAGSDDISQVLDKIEPWRELEIVDAVAALEVTLAAHDCDVVVRRYEPRELAAIILDDRDGEHAREAQATLAEASDDDVWSQVLADLTEPARPRRLVLNDANETVRALLASTDDEVRGAGAESLYVTALLASGMPLHAAEASVMNRSLALLLDRALRGGQQPPESAPPPKDLDR